MNDILDIIKLYFSILLWIFFWVISNTITTKIQSFQNENNILKWQISHFYNNDKYNNNDFQKKETIKKENMIISMIRDNFENEGVSIAKERENVISMRVDCNNFQETILKIQTIHNNINDIIEINNVRIEKDYKTNKSNILIEYIIL